MQNKTLKITAIISSICLLVIAGFCVFVVIVMHGCAAAVNEGIEQGERDAQRMKESLQEDSRRLDEALEKSMQKVRPPNLQAPAASPEWR